MEDAIMAFEQGLIDLHAKIWLRFDGLVESDPPKGKDKDFVPERVESEDGTITEIYFDRRVRLDREGGLISQYIKTTPGRIIYNKAVLEAIAS
jgi:DNA-directed RNA polymerase subunit beta'